jgi:hypothetical protein
VFKNNKSMDKSVVKNQLVEMIKQLYHKTILMEQDASLTQPTVDAFLADIEKLYKQAVLLSYWSPVEVKTSPDTKPAMEAVEEALPLVPPASVDVPSRKQEAVSTPHTTIHVPVETPVVTKETEKPQETSAPVVSSPVIPPVSSGVQVKPILKPGKKPIADIAAALSLNERFQLNNQLFKGNMEVLNEILKKLNGAESYQLAQSFLSQVKEQYQWKDENPAFQLLEELVMRRYA